MNKRLEQSIHVMREMYALGFPTDYPPLKELSQRLSDYVKTGEPWSGKIKFETYKKVAEVILPRKADRDISVVLKHSF
jgi:hypothetical protein